MDYQQLANNLAKPTWKWNTSDVQQWLNFISMGNLCQIFRQHQVDGSCLLMLEQADLQQQLIIKSKIIRKKIMKWVQVGFNEFNEYLSNRKEEQSSRSLRQIPIKRISTSMLRERIKPCNSYEQQPYLKQNNEMIVTTYQGPHANFYTINEQGCSIGRSAKNLIVVVEQSASKFHAQIMQNNGKFYIKDLASQSGTFIKVFEKYFLNERQIIEMGSFQFFVTSINHTLFSMRLQSCNMNTGQMNEIIVNLTNRKHFSFGRKDTNDFFYDDQHLSGIHSKISYFNGRFTLQDMSSTNGTWIRVGQSQVVSQPYELHHGCVFKIGTTSTYICKFNCKKQNFIPNKTVKCGLCQKNGTDCVLVPCKHNTTCYQCSILLKQCPTCNVGIQQKLKIFI